MSLFATAGKQIGCKNHFLATVGHVFPLDRTQNSGFFYTSLHVDRELFGWLYPLAELNWLHYTSSGNRGLPDIGEGDGLINLGSSDVTGHDLVTGALGVKAKLNDHMELGLAWETPLSNRKDLIDHRVLVDFIIRY